MIDSAGARSFGCSVAASGWGWLESNPSALGMSHTVAQHTVRFIIISSHKPQRNRNGLSPAQSASTCALPHGAAGATYYSKRFKGALRFLPSALRHGMERLKPPPDKRKNNGSQKGPIVSANAAHTVGEASNLEQSKRVLLRWEENICDSPFFLSFCPRPALFSFAIACKGLRM